MSQLIQLKHRIKTITVIEKITHAMRIMAMSNHARLKKYTKSLHQYANTLSPLLYAMQQYTNIETDNSDTSKDLYIVIASDKGLCGSFNNILQAYLEQKVAKDTLMHADIITVGKKATDMLEKHNITPMHSYNKLTQNKLPDITNAIYKQCINQKNSYKNIYTIYNYPQNFFTQIPTTEQLFPLSTTETTDTKQETNTFDMHTYDWPQDPREVYQALLQKTLHVHILKTLTNSLLAEQSARFISMDSATKNASGLLKKMRITYNKLRQAKITKELTELASSF